MNYCEQCGSRLTPDARFCEQCGSLAAEPEATAPAADKSASVDCLILFNGAACRERWGEAGAERFSKSLASYAATRGAQSALRFGILDAERASLSARPDYNQTLEVVRLASLARKPRFLFIVGGDEDVPMARYTDITGHDSDIASDAGYSLLTDTDLGLGMTDGTLRPDLLVGRLPIATDASPETLDAYFENASNFSDWPAPGRRKAIGVSCLKWEAASKEVAERLGRTSISTSPDLTHQGLEHELLRSEPECLYFNVHGSDSDPAWIGEGHDAMGGHPVVARPENFSRLARVNVIGTEACYGARFAGLPLAASAVMTALSSRTIAFFGSTRIAYGPHQPPNWGADTVVREFLLPLCRSSHWTSLGRAAGEILASSKRQLRGDLCARSAEVAMLRKTFLSFNLFGDPTLFSSGSSTMKSVGSSNKSGTDSDISERIEDAYVRRGADLFARIERGIGRLQSDILSRINQQVSSAFPAVAGVQPEERSFREPNGAEAFLLTYLAEGLSGFNQGVVVTCTGEGTMGRIYCFK